MNKTYIYIYIYICICIYVYVYVYTCFQPLCLWTTRLSCETLPPNPAADAALHPLHWVLRKLISAHVFLQTPVSHLIAVWIPDLIWWMDWEHTRRKRTSGGGGTHGFRTGAEIATEHTEQHGRRYFERWRQNGKGTFSMDGRVDPKASKTPTHHFRRIQDWLLGLTY